MAGGTALRFVLSTDPCRPQRSSSSCSSPVPQERGLLFRPQTVVRVAEPSAAGLRHFSRTQRFSCSGNDAASPSSHDPSEQNPPQEAVLKAISEVSKTEGRVGQTTNVVIGGTVTDDSTNEWLALDKKVNTYPTNRGFTAIGTGGDDFVQAMVFAVESVIQQPIPKGQVKQKLSSRGKYVSVNIGPIRVNSSEQVQAVYYAMRRDDRMKYFL